MSRRAFTHKRVALMGLILAMALFVISMTGTGNTDGTETTARLVSRRIERRMGLLDRHIDATLETCGSTANSLQDLPDDMVIYLYVNDSLQSWNNQFPILNDRISTRPAFQRLTPVNNRITSPLTDITEKPEYMNLGSRWYIVKAVNGTRNEKVIAGLEIKNTITDDIGKNDNGANARLRIPNRYSIHPLDISGGSAVVVDGTPLFKISYDSIRQYGYFDHSVLRWFAMILFVAAMVVFMAGHRTFKAYFSIVPILTILLVVSYMWGLRMTGTYQIFSPSIFADGTFQSLGCLLIVNTYITLLNVCTFFIKGRIGKFLLQDRKTAKRKCIIFGIAVVSVMVLTAMYIHLTLTSFLNNSNVNLELYRIGSNGLYSLIVYLSYTGLLFCLMLQVQLLKPAIHELTGRHIDILKHRYLVGFALLASAYFSITSQSLGFRKEQDRVLVWSNRLAVERDLALELQLRSVEESISNDHLISYLTSLDNPSGIILSRITEYYLNRVRQSDNIGVFVFKEGDDTGENLMYSIIHNGEPIAEGSRFMFISDIKGRSSYAGIFMYYYPGAGVTRVILQIEQNRNAENSGYGRIIGRTDAPGNVNIPASYSYAKYKNGHLTTYRGAFPYPTVHDRFLESTDPRQDVSTVRLDGYVHFITKVGEGETVVITRPKRNVLIYFTSFSYLFLVLMLLAFILPPRKKAPKMFRKNYFRTRINVILFTSSFFILASMAIVSIAFVYKRNEKNMFNMMSSKVRTVQGLLEDRTRYAKDWNDLMTQAFTSSLKEVSNATKSDITIYSQGGKVIRSTTPEVFEKLLLGSRINYRMFHNIRNRNQRFYTNRETVAGYRFWVLYAPLFNDAGDMIAIMSIPYTDSNYDFRSEAFFHAALLINLFILLLLISLFISTRLVDTMFKPLVEIGKKMDNADINNLEYITYEGEDEISSLVEAYNRMVSDLKNSTRKLAQAERDKAWSQMARQVAHEIKNPLTPIKLEIQRLVRLKQNNNPKWEEKFEQVTAVILEHIQILADTANDFSTFAKLYTEKPVLMDLDKTLKEQLLIFDNKDNIRFSYIGMENALVMAPKPQLIRVFVNLITNGIQAIEIQQKEQQEDGQEPVQGRLIICLRNSTQDGFYDIVFDDNGPGVSGENLTRLFTPNFTTKSGGTGLGLAICRNIVEKCGGTISYRKSFALGGACFTVTIPKTAASSCSVITT